MMGNASSKRRNNLELYLKDVYEKECVCKISDKEVEFIKTGEEALVKEIVDSTLENESMAKIQKTYADWLEKQEEKVNQCPTNIVGVGSFYEKTKNGFPDEFDFIVLLGMYSNSNKEIFPENLVESIVEYIFQKNRGDFTNFTNGTRKLYFLSADYMTGPAIRLLFQYENGSGRGKTINVDVVPAYKLSNICSTKAVSELCALRPFCEEIIHTGSYLSVYPKRITFTETEVNFERNVMSKNHVKVFRILKYLINGHGTGDYLEECLGVQLRSKHYSSYKIKTMMIYHHYECTNPDAADIGPCVLQVLYSISRYGDNATFPSIVRIPKLFEDHRKLCLKGHIVSLAETLEEMKEQGGGYDYEKCKIKQSLSKQYAYREDIELTSTKLVECSETLVKHLW